MNQSSYRRVHNNRLFWQLLPPSIPIRNHKNEWADTITPKLRLLVALSVERLAMGYMVQGSNPRKSKRFPSTEPCTAETWPTQPPIQWAA